MGRICLEIRAELPMINDGEGAMWKCYVHAETGKPLCMLQEFLILSLSFGTLVAESKPLVLQANYFIFLFMS